MLRYGDKERELLGAEPQTTNNRMELTAVLSALRELKHPCRVRITTDSKYVMDGVGRWLPNWKRNGWRTANRKPVKNRELWEALDEELTRHEVSWEWVKGHAGHPENERADALANAAIERMGNASGQAL